MRILAILLFAAACCAQAPRQAALRGHVYAREGGRPLRNALLTLATGALYDFRYTVTDSFGSYEFRDIAPGSYRMDCYKAGYLPAEISPRGFRVGRQDREGMNFRLLRSAAISGRVLDEDGEPLAGVTMTVIAESYGQGRRARPLQTQTRTSQDGRYRLSFLTPGRYWVSAHFEKAEFGYAPLFYFNALSPAEGRPVDVGPGGEVDRIDFQMRRGVRLSRLSGRVVDERRNLVEGGSISASLADVDLGQFTLGSIRRDGQFEIPNLVPGRYVVTINVPNRNTVIREVYVGADTTLGEVLIGPGTTVRGRISYLGDPQVLRGRLIELAGWDQPRGMINPDLTFEVQNVQPGQHAVSLRPRRGVDQAGLSDGDDPFYIAAVRMGERDVTETGVPVLERQAPINVEVILGADGGTMKGELRGEAGQPLAESQVALVPASGRQRFFDTRMFRTVATDEQGRYVIRGIMPGAYLLLPWPYGNAVYLLRPEFFARLEKFAVRVVVEKESEIRKDLEISKDFRAIVDEWIP